LVTIKFRSFQEYKDYILAAGQGNPNRYPYRFHTIGANNTVAKIVEVYAGGNVVLLYVSPTNETILPTDAWLNANPDTSYPASIVVSDINETVT